jgi:hypothetical protein
VTQQKLSCIQADGLLDSLQVRYNKDRHQYQLVKGGPGEGAEEVVLRLTGILTHCELPPVLKLPRYFQHNDVNEELTPKF